MDSELAEAVREAADDDTQNVSAWLAATARGRLATRGLRDVIAEWESANGLFSEDELAAARQRLGAWRDGKRRALLSRALRHCDELAFDGLIARAAGSLCGQTGTADVIDATFASPMPRMSLR